MTRRRLLATIALTLGGTIGLVVVASAQIVEIRGRPVIAVRHGRKRTVISE
jgi:hypothetical protein